MIDAIGTFLLALLCVICIALGIWMGWGGGYREGQIDALNGAIYYKLEKQSDSEFRWIECQGICRYGKEGEE